MSILNLMTECEILLQNCLSQNSFEETLIIAAKKFLKLSGIEASGFVSHNGPDEINFPYKQRYLKLKEFIEDITMGCRYSIKDLDEFIKQLTVEEMSLSLNSLKREREEEDDLDKDDDTEHENLWQDVKIQSGGKCVIVVKGNKKLHTM